MNGIGGISNRQTLWWGFALLSFLIALGILYSLLIYRTVQEQAVAENREANLAQAEAAGRFIAQEQEALSSLLAVIASRASLRAALAAKDQEALLAFLHPLAEMGPKVRAVFLADPAGAYLLQVPRPAGPSLSGAPGAGGDGPLISNLVPARPGDPGGCLLLSVPIKDEKGALVARLGVTQPAAHWKTLFARLSSRPGRSFFLFDRAGALITTGLDKAELPSDRLMELAAEVRRALPAEGDHWAGMRRLSDNRERVFAAAARVAPSGWVVVAAHEYQAAMAPARAMLRNLYLLLGLLFLCLLFVGFILYTRFRAQDRRLVRLDGQARHLEALVKERTADLEMSTQRYLSLVQDLPDMVYELDQAGRFTFVSQAASRILGHRPEEMLGRAYRDFILPPDRAKFDRQRAGGESGKALNIMALRHTTADNRECWLSIHSQGLLDGRGQFLGRRGVARDVTQQVLAEQRVHQLSGQLINAQEEERKQLAMDLHDEMGQLLSALKIGLQTQARTNPAVRPDLDRLIGLTQEIMDRSRNLAYRLRPAILDSFGLTASIADLCESLSEDGVLKVERQLDQIDDHLLGPAVKTTLFRFVQEALTNALKHSASDRVQVRLAGEPGLVRAEVRDFGRGFDLDKTMSQTAPRHLGLLGMRERLNLIGGNLVIKSGPGGTVLKAEIPLGGLR